MIRLMGICALLVAWAAPSVQAETLRMAVTTSFANSGLSDILLPAIRADTGLEVQLLVVGTGQALRLAAAGDVDAVLAHARAAEDQLVADGHATHRREIMYNDFVLIGPADDPAEIAQADTAAGALARIAGGAQPFVSRGDNSGTHVQELALWQAAGIEPQGRWYRATGSGMGAALNFAVATGGYILSDRATWLSFGNKGDLAILFAGDAALFNQYAYLPVNPDRHPHVNAAAAHRLEGWLTSERARDLIDGFTIAGTQLFTFNATGD